MTPLSVAGTMADSNENKNWKPFRYHSMEEEPTRISFNDEGRNAERIWNKSNSSEKVEMQLFSQPEAIGTDSDHSASDLMIKSHRLIEPDADESSATASKTINAVVEELDPIAEYANEPILPLSKACTPLETIIPNLPVYVKIALEETPEQPSDGLTIDESAAVRLYTMEWNESRQSLYSTLNGTLKKGTREHLRPYFKYLKLFLTALVKIPCGSQETIWRGVRRNLSAEFPAGRIVTWWGFTSCTTEIRVLENPTFLGDHGDRTMFSVESINGRLISSHSQFDTENERLLLPGTQLVVLSQVSPAPDLHVIHLRQIIPEQMLLAPPFEGTMTNLSYQL